MKKLDIACLIDDDKMFTYLVSKQMRLIDFCDSILIFNDGDEALRYLRPIVENPDTLPSVILLDINMPVLDGWQFLDEFVKFNVTKKSPSILLVPRLIRLIRLRQPVTVKCPIFMLNQ